MNMQPLEYIVLFCCISTGVNGGIIINAEEIKVMLLLDQKFTRGTGRAQPPKYMSLHAAQFPYAIFFHRFNSMYSSLHNFAYQSFRNLQFTVYFLGDLYFKCTNNGSCNYCTNYPLISFIRFCTAQPMLSLKPKVSYTHQARTNKNLLSMKYVSSQTKHMHV